MQDLDYKKEDKQAIVQFLRGKVGVTLADIISSNCANRLRVYNLLFELEQEGRLIVIEREPLGAPIKVTLTE